MWLEFSKQEALFALPLPLDYRLQIIWRKMISVGQFFV